MNYPTENGGELQCRSGVAEIDRKPAMTALEKRAVFFGAVVAVAPKLLKEPPPEPVLLSQVSSPVVPPPVPLPLRFLPLPEPLLPPALPPPLP